MFLRADPTARFFIGVKKIDMELVYKKLDEISPYGQNPRKNDEAVPKVAESIKEFGFKVPIVVDAGGVIVCGHTRYRAAQSLGMKEVPCIVADDLTPAQVSAFRLADNKVAEFSGWDFSALEREIAGLDGLMDLSDLGFEEFYVTGVDDFFEYEEDKPKPKQESIQENGNETADGAVNETAEPDGETVTTVTEETEKKKTTIVCPHCGKEIEI